MSSTLLPISKMPHGRDIDEPIARRSLTATPAVRAAMVALHAVRPYEESVNGMAWNVVDAEQLVEALEGVTDSDERAEVALRCLTDVAWLDPLTEGPTAISVDIRRVLRRLEGIPNYPQSN